MPASSPPSFYSCSEKECKLVVCRLEDRLQAHTQTGLLSGNKKTKCWAIAVMPNYSERLPNQNSTPPPLESSSFPAPTWSSTVSTCTHAQARPRNFWGCLRLVLELAASCQSRIRLCAQATTSIRDHQRDEVPWRENVLEQM
jgi:hypothetical protein